MKRSIVPYWIATGLLGVAYIAMGGSNYWQPGTMALDIARSGYPSHFFKLLGVFQVLGGVVVLTPGIPRLKEWAYAGVLINLVAATHHHVIARDRISQIAFPLILLAIAVGSYFLRPASRRIEGPLF